jgi:ATP-dependent Clp protease ATP-binding subunit ClpA
MFERLDTDARVAVVHAAGEEARALGSAGIEAEHLLLALAGDGDSETGRLLADVGLDREGVHDALARESERSLAAVGVDIRALAPGEPASSPRHRPKLAASSKRALEWALRTAIGRSDHRISSPHLLIGILRADIGTVPRALALADIDRAELAARVERLLDEGP